MTPLEGHWGRCLTETGSGVSIVVLKVRRLLVLQLRTLRPQNKIKLLLERFFMCMERLKILRLGCQVPTTRGPVNQVGTRGTRLGTGW